MALTKRLSGGRMARPSNGKTSAGKLGKSARADGLTLPEEKSKPIEAIEDAVTLLYGEKKIGKTSLASEFDDPFFLMCEPGGKGLQLHQRLVPDWKTFVGYVDLIERTTRFRTIVVDTVDKAYEKCFEFVCKRDVMDHPSDEAFGKGWNAIETEFVKQMDRIVHSGRGVLFISHAEVREFQGRTGGSYSKIVPSMSTAARRYIAGIADVMAYYGYYGPNRYLTIQGSDSLEAGHRLKYNFWTTSGERVHSIPMHDRKNKRFGEEEAYKRFVVAFKNEQAETGEPELTTALSETPVKRTSRRG